MADLRTDEIADRVLDEECQRYIFNLRAWWVRKNGDVRLPPDEAMMACIEGHVEPVLRIIDEFRSNILNTAGALSIDGKKFTADTNERLGRALRQALKDEARKTGLELEMKIDLSKSDSPFINPALLSNQFRKGSKKPRAE